MKDNYILEFPKVIRIEPSATCNLSCVHCPTGTYGNPVKGKMSKEVFIKIKNNIMSHNIRVAVLYMGGEPFINKDFFFFVDELKNINIPFIKTVSNGMLLNDKTIDNIIKSKLSSIEFSLDGTSGEMNDFIRKNSSHEKVISNVKKLLELKILNNAKIEVIISSTQFKYFDDNNILQPSRPNWLENIFRKYLDLNILKIQYTDAMEWSDMKLDKNIFESIEITNDKEKNICDHIISTMTIRYDGSIVPCCYDLTSKLIMGNINEDKLENIWNNDKYIKLRKSINEKKFYSICNNCNVVKKNKFLIIKNTNKIC